MYLASGMAAVPGSVVGALVDENDLFETFLRLYEPWEGWNDGMRLRVWWEEVWPEIWKEKEFIDDDNYDDTFYILTGTVFKRPGILFLGAFF